jgi:hypothetical protein
MNFARTSVPQLLPVYPAGQSHEPSAQVPPFRQVTPSHGSSSLQPVIGMASTAAKRKSFENVFIVILVLV